ncbi:MAG TPA: hypothetical protein VFU43_08350 [Streptosporangiaceae bacterium]|nr:hypothetical protein [Streptosporangiaceae bacterium]
MLWVIEETRDCGVHWRRAEYTACYRHPRVAVLEAMEIIRDEWRPSEHSWRQLVHALERERVAYYWERGIRIVRPGDHRSPIA